VNSNTHQKNVTTVGKVLGPSYPGTPQFERLAVVLTKHFGWITVFSGL